MFRLMDEGRGLFLLGNHDRKLGRVLAGDRVRIGPELEATLAALDDPLKQRMLHETTRAPVWLMHGARFFVHAAFHTAMLGNAPPAPLGPVDPLLSRALFGETTGRTQPDGFPERLLRWVNHIPAGITVYCGHDQRSARRPPLYRPGRQRRHRGVHGHRRRQGRAFVVDRSGLKEGEGLCPLVAQGGLEPMAPLRQPTEDTS